MRTPCKRINPAVDLVTGRVWCDTCGDQLAHVGAAEKVVTAARWLMSRADFWDSIHCKPGEYDDLADALREFTAPSPPSAPAGGA